MPYQNSVFFRDRQEAGVKLAQLLAKYSFKNPRVFGLPRGGVVVANEVAKHLACPLEVVMVRKIGAPGQPEYGIGAMSEDERPLFNPEVFGHYKSLANEVDATVARETRELRRRISLYRGSKSIGSLKNFSAIVVDDGLATGVSAAAAGKYLKTLNPSKLILAVPVGPTQIGQLVRDNYDEVICLQSVSHLVSIGQWYQHFNQIEDHEVLSILNPGAQESYHLI